MTQVMTVREDRLKKQIFLEQDPAKQAELKRMLALELRRPARIQEWLPPLDESGQPAKKKYLLTLDRATDSALEFLRRNPVKDGTKPLELAWMVRIAIQEFAEEAGWQADSTSTEPDAKRPV